jgi:ribosomal protein S18 acetylase RimI-like enzyme
MIRGLEGPLPESLFHILDDAILGAKEASNEKERAMKLERIEKVRQGLFETAMVTEGDVAICLLAFHRHGSEAGLRFGHMAPGHERDCAAALDLSLSAMADRGIISVSSIFNWPQHDLFAEAAPNAGFSVVERINMVRHPEAADIHRSVPEEIDIVPLNGDHLADAARIIFESAFPGDAAFHKPYRTLEGSMRYLEEIQANRYGDLLPELSFAARIGGRQVGQILVARLQSVGVNIVDLAVDASYRRRGIARSLIQKLIEANSAGANEDIHLTVTAANEVALRLYGQMGFERVSKVDYFFFETEGTRIHHG